MTEIKLYKSSLYGWFMLISCLLFLFLSTFLLFEENFLMGLLGLLFSTFGIFGGLYFVFDKKPQIIINQKGIWRRKAMWTKYDANKIIEWHSIKGAYTRSVENNKFICLIPVQIEEKKQNPIQKNLAKLNTEMGFQDLNINLALMQIDEHKLVDFLNSMIVTNDSQREHLILNFIIPIPKSFFSKFKI